MKFIRLLQFRSAQGVQIHVASVTDPLVLGSRCHRAME